MAKFGLSQSVRRVEDPRLLLGNGLYTDDIALEGQVHGHVLRSPHAHAIIRGIDGQLSDLGFKTTDANLAFSLCLLEQIGKVLTGFRRFKFFHGSISKFLNLL